MPQTGQEYETHLSAQQTQACTNPWLPRPYEHPRWTPRDQGPPRQGSRPPDAGLKSVNGFPKERRLSGASSFDRLFKAGRRFRTPILNAYTLPAATAASRLGITVSRKNVRRAVDRNRLKRLIRESFRLNAHRIANTDIVIQATPRTLSAQATDIRDTLERLWAGLHNVGPHNPSI